MFSIWVFETPMAHTTEKTTESYLRIWRKAYRKMRTCSGRATPVLPDWRVMAQAATLQKEEESQ